MERIHRLGGHTGKINAIIPVVLDGFAYLASGSDDRSVRIWSTTTWTCVLTIPVQHRALSLCFHAGILYVGLPTGVLALKLTAPPLS